MEQVAWVAALIFVCWAGWLDWRSRRIPNWLTVPGLLAGMAVSTLAAGWAGFKSGLAGAGLMLALLLPFVILRGLGAGDWKLMGALGAFLGTQQILTVFLLTLLIAGVMAVLQITWRGQWRASLRNLMELVRGAFIFRLRPHPTVTLDNPRLPKLPFGVAAAVATSVCFWLSQAA